MSANGSIRIASGQGFWGDWLEAPVRQVTGGPIDYLMMDYLAEVTMSIMQKQRARDPALGYAKDFVPLMDQLLPEIVGRGIRVTANAGGVNPLACAEAVIACARERGLAGKLKVGLVTGDDILPRLERLMGRGHEFCNMDTAEPLTTVLDRVQSANVYLGAWPIVAALERGSDIVITGRVTDTGLALAPMIHSFGWGEAEWSKLAAGTVAGHIIECGAQCTGGNCMVNWERIPGMDDPGYPIVEARPEGEFVVTKHDGTGGRVSVASVTEQLLYEMGDPHNYITPDCVVDFTSAKLEQQGEDRVRVSGVRGLPATDSFKVSISYLAGYKATGHLTVAGPDAVAKARVCAEALWGRLRRAGFTYEETITELVGLDACHGAITPPPPVVHEVVLRVGVRDSDRAKVDRFGKELAPLVTSGPPGVTGFAGGRPKATEVLGFWPALVPKDLVKPEVNVEAVP